MRLGRSHLVRFTAALCSFFISTVTVADNKTTSVCTDYPSVEIVFVGTLTAFTPSQTSSSMRFEALELLAGESSDGITVLQEGGSPCRNPAPIVGERYLVVAQGTNWKGDYGCADLKREADATSEIEYFRLARSGLTSTEVSGEVRITGEGTPVRGAKVDLAGIAGGTQLTSNAQGRFHAVLKPGTYAVTTRFPIGYESDNCGGSTVTLEPYRCARLVICAKPRSGGVNPIE